MNSNVVLKKMQVYILHRSDLLDHKNGRPAILIDYQTNDSLVWFGVNELVNDENEQPMIIKINNKITYFYFSGFVWVKNKFLIGKWVDCLTNEICELSLIDQQNLINKITSFTYEKNPYLEINMINNTIHQFRSMNKKIRIENDKLTRENHKLVKENEKLRKTTK